MKITITILGIVFMLGMLVSCKQKSQGEQEQALPADLINNPASAEGDREPGQLPIMAFEKDEHDFGRLIQGETVSYGFKFKNEGKSDLLISSVSSSCGCTVTDYPKNPTPPGKEGIVLVTFKSEGRRGFQHKSVTVMANTQPNTKVLKIKAEVRSLTEE